MSTTATASVKKYKLPVRHEENYSGEHRDWIVEYALPDWLVAEIQNDAAHRSASVAAMVEALDPFAKMADHVDDTPVRRDAIYCGGSPGLICEITRADYHRARTALARYREGETT